MRHMRAHLVCAVEVAHVLFIKVGRRNVGAPAKPPLAGDAVPLLRLKVAVVEVHRGAERVVRVHHTADAGCEEGNTASRLAAQQHVVNSSRHNRVGGGFAFTNFLYNASSETRCLACCLSNGFSDCTFPGSSPLLQIHSLGLR